MQRTKERRSERLVAEAESGVGVGRNEVSRWR